jgi:hypothetical protein
MAITSHKPQATSDKQVQSHRGRFWPVAFGLWLVAFGRWLVWAVVFGICSVYTKERSFLSRFLCPLQQFFDRFSSKDFPMQRRLRIGLRSLSRQGFRHSMPFCREEDCPAEGSPCGCHREVQRQFFAPRVIRLHGTGSARHGSTGLAPLPGSSGKRERFSFVRPIAGIHSAQPKSCFDVEDSGSSSSPGRSRRGRRW